MSERWPGLAGIDFLDGGIWVAGTRDEQGRSITHLETVRGRFGGRFLTAERISVSVSGEVLSTSFGVLGELPDEPGRLMIRLHFSNGGLISSTSEEIVPHARWVFRGRWDEPGDTRILRATLIKDEPDVCRDLTEEKRGDVWVQTSELVYRRQPE